MANQQDMLQVVDLTKYAETILSDEDRPLFDEAVLAAKFGALRAAYVMIWLTCAESLKRRFREARVRDDTASKILSRIEKLEQQHKATDKPLLDKALEYGFVSESEHAILTHVYELRCIYGHPYQEAPTSEKLIDAAASVVLLVLSRPVKLRQGFGRQLLVGLLRDRNYLDDFEPTVTVFAQNILPRLDESIYVWLLDEYWKELEKISDDSSMDIFTRRGLWFCRAMLAEVGAATLSHEEWHSKSVKFPKTLVRVCSTADIFQNIGDHAQDSIVGFILDESKSRASLLPYLERLCDEDALSERQQARFTKRLSELESSATLASGLSTTFCYSILINELESYNWYRQNAAIQRLVSNGPDQAAELTDEQQVYLGRNILQSGDETAVSALEFLENLNSGHMRWPLGIVLGIALETFTNESNGIRIKVVDYIEYVLSGLDRLGDAERTEIINAIVASVAAGTPSKASYAEDYGRISSSLRAYDWATPLVKILEAKLPTKEPTDV